MVDDADTHLHSRDLFADGFEVYGSGTFCLERDHVGIHLIEELQGGFIGLHLREHALLGWISPAGVTPHFRLIPQTLDGVVEDLEHELRIDDFVNDAAGCQQVDLGFLQLDHGTPCVGQIMQFFVEGVAQRHNARGQVLVVLVLNCESDQFGRDRSKLNWLRGQTLRRLPNFGVLHLAAIYGPHDPGHDARFQIVMENVSAGKGDAPRTGGRQFRMCRFEA